MATRPPSMDGVLCFLVADENYESWKRHLESAGIGILREIDWSRGRSFCFEVPDGNLLGIANADLRPA